MITIEDMVECAERELGMRRRVYPRWVEQNKMKPDAAAHEIEAMAAILAYLTAVRDTPDCAPVELPPPRRAPPAQGSLL